MVSAFQLEITSSATSSRLKLTFWVILRSIFFYSGSTDLENIDAFGKADASLHFQLHKSSDVIAPWASKLDLPSVKHYKNGRFSFLD